MTTTEHGSNGRVEVEFDHHSAEFRENNYAQFDELRSKCPVTHSSTHGGFWVFSDYATVFEAARDDDMFNSYPSVGVPASEMPFPIIPIESDPPLTQKLRSILLNRFSPKATDTLEPKARELATELIDGFIERGSCDIVQELTTPLPARLTLHMLGMDESKYEHWVHWVHSTVHDRASDPEKAGIAGMEMFGEIAEHMAQRRSEGFGDDALSALMQAKIDGTPLDDVQITMYTVLLLMGGMDTTSGLTGNAMIRLIERPELRQRLIEDRDLLPDATEEFLRYDTPTQGLARTIGKDGRFCGFEMKKGERAVLLWAAANRDPAVFEDPDVIDFDRQNKKHLAFGVGAHRCMGSSLARMMFRVMMDEILTRLPDFELAGTPERFEDAAEVYAVSSMPIRFTPGPRVGDGAS
ncbi:cytochrome P450 [Nocardia jinanensis]|uniref:Cytochrome P450 n=1 Tax=Nocardia jinanensis TaxID=382504 RepID=A0A917VTS4_9NOCA|nr:cytochrome P450 [Nocardia jinanensis]GGL13777.1 cytochrome P450 [Nocardia jinanensis]